MGREVRACAYRDTRLSRPTLCARVDVTALEIALEPDSCLAPAGADGQLGMKDTGRG